MRHSLLLKNSTNRNKKLTETKLGYLMHTWSDKAIKGTVLTATPNYVYSPLGNHNLSKFSENNDFLDKKLGLKHYSFNRFK